MKLDFGASMDGIAQIAFTVADLRGAAEQWTKSTRIGPWFVRGPFTPAEARYRGKPTYPSLSLARAFSGATMIELIEQHDDTPSVYLDGIARNGYGLHHCASMTDSFDSKILQACARGGTVEFEDSLPSGSRVAYVLDDPIEPFGYHEYIEYTPAQESVYTKYFHEGLTWDGADPWREG